MKSKLFSKNIFRQIIPLALFFAFFFSVTAILQYFFVEYQTTKAIESQLESWANEVNQAVKYEDRWNRKEFDRTLQSSPNYCIVTNNGLVFDIYNFDKLGFIPALTNSSSLLNKLKTEKLQWDSTEAGEKWRLCLKRIKNGFVILGIPNTENAKRTDFKLETNRKKFGDTLTVEVAAQPSFSRNIEQEVDYAILDDANNLRFQSGGIPLRIDTSYLFKFSQKILKIKNLRDIEFLVLSVPVTASLKNKVGTILVSQDLTLQQQALSQQKKFSTYVGIVSWVIVVLFIIGFVAVSRKRQVTPEISVEEALRRGEGQYVEFKQGFNPDSLGVSVTAFANAEGGNIFLGIRDDGEPIGITVPTLQDKDRLIRKLTDEVIKLIKPRIKITTSFCDCENRTILKIFVPKRTRPVYFFKDKIFIRNNVENQIATPDQVDGLFKDFIE